MLNADERTCTSKFIIHTVLIYICYNMIVDTLT